jgi:serine phosphatase RsbU (regulator of sigma subunit)
LSVALGVAMYLWLHLRATRMALTEHERMELVIQTQLSLAEATQRRLLPPVPPAAGGCEWAATLAPAGKIGGDFYDFVDAARGIRLMLIADVSGKGIAAAMALTLLRSTFRRLARDTHDPAQLAKRMSDAFYDEWSGTPYVTGVVARFDLQARTLTYSNAGHPFGVLVGNRADRDLDVGGPPLGLLPDSRYSAERLELAGGDVYIFMTDGVTEALDDVRRARAVVTQTLREGTRSATRICDALMRRALEGRGPADVDDWTDDRTVVVVAIEKGVKTSSSLSDQFGVHQPDMVSTS